MSNELPDLTTLDENTPIADLTLSVRAWNVLNEAGFKTVGDVKEFAARGKYIRLLKGCGKKSEQEICRLFGLPLMLPATQDEIKAEPDITTLDREALARMVGELQGELHLIDQALARRPALDDCKTRAEKAWRACDTAALLDRQLADAHGYEIRFKALEPKLRDCEAALANTIAERDDLIELHQAGERRLIAQLAAARAEANQAQAHSKSVDGLLLNAQRWLDVFKTYWLELTEATGVVTASRLTSDKHSAALRWIQCKRAEVERLTKQVKQLRYVPAACPCHHTTPCDPDCSCVNSASTRGCDRCCTHGGIKQQRAQAERLAGVRDDANLWMDETGKLLIDNARLRDEVLRMSQEIARLEGEFVEIERELAVGKDVLTSHGYEENELAFMLEGLFKIVGEMQAENERLRVELEQEIATSERVLMQNSSRWAQLVGKLAGESDGLRAALAQVGEAGWQPIATAPKDGTSIFVWPYWSEDFATEVSWVEYEEAASRWVAPGGVWCQANPTHWMPLPEPPAVAIVAASAKTAGEQPMQDNFVFDYCKTGEHDKCIGQSDKLYRDGRLILCACRCHWRRTEAAAEGQEAADGKG